MQSRAGFHGDLEPRGGDTSMLRWRATGLVSFLTSLDQVAILEDGRNKSNVALGFDGERSARARRYRFLPVQRVVGHLNLYNEGHHISVRNSDLVRIGARRGHQQELGRNANDVCRIRHRVNVPGWNMGFGVLLYWRSE